MRYAHLAQRMFNVPLAITPSKAEVVMAALADRLGIAKLFKANGDVIILADGGSCSDIGAGDEFGGPRESYKGYDVVAGIAVIQVYGTLVQKNGTMRPYSGMTGYDGIRANLSLAVNDPAVRAIVLDIDSPGGEVAGCFDLVDAIYSMRKGDKPVDAILSEHAYSAAYAIASACRKIYVPRTGGTGSVGVICMHVDFSKALSQQGINVTLITYGDRKADGNQYSPLEAEALKRIQADTDFMGDLFVKTVARNRGLSISKVRDTQALTFLGAESVANGFADAVMAPDMAFKTLLAELG